MAIFVVVGSMILGATLLVFFSNVYLEIACKRARERRQQAKLSAATALNQPMEAHEKGNNSKGHENIFDFVAHIRAH
ncbi:hypothetical protein ACFQX9_11535 [Bradyrhizobium sp. GCM10028915]|uniref:hypothetical protein n=1 Tax=Bradyrhizobium sp. GCM10028915 TaxID=3273385 RepID=UPI0036114F4F